jgi:hypothetical protein
VTGITEQNIFKLIKDAGQGGLRRDDPRAAWRRAPRDGAEGDPGGQVIRAIEPRFKAVRAARADDVRGSRSLQSSASSTKPSDAASRRSWIRSTAPRSRR